MPRRSRRPAPTRQRLAIGAVVVLASAGPAQDAAAPEDDPASGPGAELLPPPGELDFLALPFEPETAAPAPAPPEYPAFALPPVERFLPPRAVPLPTLRVNEFRFEGNTVFDDS